MTPQALATLEQICVSGESESARVTAATAILDRAWGKPAQSLELSQPDNSADVLRITLERMRRDPVTAQAMLVIAEASAKGE